MRVYRLESKEPYGFYYIGPFHAGVIYSHVPLSYHTPENGFPCPSMDGIKEGWDRNENNVCGCESIKQLLKWFPATAIRALREEDFGIAVYEVDDDFVLYGRTQVIFDVTEAERIMFK